LQTRCWDARTSRWSGPDAGSETPDVSDPQLDVEWSSAATTFGVIHADGRASAIVHGSNVTTWAGSFDGTQWIAEPGLLEEVDVEGHRSSLQADGRSVFS